MRRLSSSEQDLLNSLHDMLLARRSSEITPDIIAKVTHLVRSMTDPRPQLGDLVGPVCTTADLVNWFGITRQGINKAVRENRIVAVQSPTTTWFYPIWQLTDSRAILPNLAQVHGRLVGQMAPVQAAQWYVQQNPMLGGRTPAELLREGAELRPLVEAAEAHARHMRRSGASAEAYATEVVTVAV